MIAAARWAEVHERSRALAVSLAIDETSSVAASWVLFDDALRSGSELRVLHTARDLAAAIVHELVGYAQSERSARDRSETDATGLVHELEQLAAVARDLYALARATKAGATARNLDEFTNSDKRTQCPTSDKPPSCPTSDKCTECPNRLRIASDC